MKLSGELLAGPLAESLLDELTGLTALGTDKAFDLDPGLTGTANMLVGTDIAMPGDGVKLRVSLGRPIALPEGDRFAVREGGKTVGSGVVTKVTS